MPVLRRDTRQIVAGRPQGGGGASSSGSGSKGQRPSNYGFTKKGGTMAYARSGGGGMRVGTEYGVYEGPASGFQDWMREQKRQRKGGGGGMAKKGGKNIKKLLKQLLEQLQTGETQAREAGEEQYQNLLESITGLKSQVGGTFGRAEQMLGQVGEAQRRRVQAAGKQASAASRQDLISRGLGNTTVVDAVQRGINTDTQRAMQELSGQEAAQALGLLTQRAGSERQLGALEADAILSRQIESPRTSEYLSLIQALGQYTS